MFGTQFDIEEPDVDDDSMQSDAEYAFDGYVVVRSDKVALTPVTIGRIGGRRHG